MPTESQYRRAAEDKLAVLLNGDNPDVEFSFSACEEYHEFAQVEFNIFRGRNQDGYVVLNIDDHEAAKQPIEDVPDRD